MKQWHETREVLDRLAELAREGKRAALATVVRVRGSAYRHEGAKLLVGEDGSTTGNVSGGCLEQDVREVALQVIRSGKAELRNYCSSADEIEAWDLGVGCEGEVEVFVEPVTEPRPRERELLDRREPFVVATIVGMRDAGCGMRLIMTADDSAGDLESTELNGAVTTQARALLGTEQSGLHEIAGRSVFFDVFCPPPQLVLLGAGEDARPLARLAADVGFRVVVVDRRPGYLTNERFPTAARLVESDGAELAERLSLDGASYAVVMTHNFADDQAYLRALLRTPVPYIGMLGPRQRTERIVRNLSAAGAVDEGRLYGPVGLDIGTDGAEQVALAVIAEVLAVRSGRPADSLRERKAPIHARPTEPTRIAGVILAAGASRRMGKNKMLLELEGEAVVRRATRRALAAGLSPVVVVLGHEATRAQAELAGLACEFVVNPAFTGPTSGSLHGGLERLDPDIGAAVVMLADMVLVTEQMLAAIVAASRGSDAPLVVSRYGDVTAPPLLFRRGLFAELLAWTGEGCGKTVVQRHRDEALFMDWPAEALMDVDTPEDFAAAVALTRSRSPERP